MDWYNARLWCQALRSGADLASMTSDSLEMMLFSLAGDGSKTEEFWTGGNDIGDDTQSFEWVRDGTTFWRAGPPVEEIGYNNWYATQSVFQPTHDGGQDCLKMKFRVQSGILIRNGWDDVNCITALKTACQYHKMDN